MKEANREFQDILKDIQQNQILHMAMPDKELENMAQSVNQALEQIRTERQEYEKRERAFQSEIENISHDLRTPLTVIFGIFKADEGTKGDGHGDGGDDRAESKDHAKTGDRFL